MDPNQLMQRLHLYGRKIHTHENGQQSVHTEFKGYRKEKRVIDFIEFPEGCELWVEGERYPIRTAAQPDRVADVTKLKRLLPVFLNSFKGNVFRKLIAFLYLKYNWQEYVDFMHRGLSDTFYPDVRFYSQPVREVYRKTEGKMRDIVCSILEFDSAYRYRFQDIMSELDKRILKYDPIGELRRLTNLYIERETQESMKGKAKIFTYALWYLKFDRKLREKVVGILESLDIDELRPSKEDRYWMNAGYEEYNSQGLNYEERQKQYYLEKNYARL